MHFSRLSHILFFTSHRSPPAYRLSLTHPSGWQLFLCPPPQGSSSQGPNLHSPFLLSLLRYGGQDLIPSSKHLMEEISSFNFSSLISKFYLLEIPPGKSTRISKAIYSTSKSLILNKIVPLLVFQVF